MKKMLFFFMLSFCSSLAIAQETIQTLEDNLSKIIVQKNITDSRLKNLEEELSVTSKTLQFLSMEEQTPSTVLKLKQAQTKAKDLNLKLVANTESLSSILKSQEEYEKKIDEIKERKLPEIVAKSEAEKIAKMQAANEETKKLEAQKEARRLVRIKPESGDAFADFKLGIEAFKTAYTQSANPLQKNSLWEERNEWFGTLYGAKYGWQVSNWKGDVITLTQDSVMVSCKTFNVLCVGISKDKKLADSLWDVREGNQIRFSGKFLGDTTHLFGVPGKSVTAIKDYVIRNLSNSAASTQASKPSSTPKPSILNTTGEAVRRGNNVIAADIIVGDTADYEFTGTPTFMFSFSEIIKPE